MQLAVACYNISSLLQCSWCFVADSPLMNPEFAFATKTNDPLVFTDIFNVQELNLACFTEEIPSSCLSDDVLLKSGTSLKIEMFLQAPQSAPVKCLASPSIYQKMIVLTSNDLLATNLLNQILLHNQKCFTAEVVVTNFLKSGAKAKLDKETGRIGFVSGVAENNEVVTGFMIDNVNWYVFFVEGSPTGLIMTLWQQMMNVSVTVVRNLNVKLFSTSITEQYNI